MGRLMVSIAVVAAFTLALVGCGVAGTAGGQGIEVRDAWARPASLEAMDNAPDHSAAMTAEMAMEQTAASGVTSAAYLTIRNNGAADRLVRVESDVAASAELHTAENNNGVMSMRQVDGIDLPANGEVVLKPGGFHIMMLDVQRDLNPGDTIALTLHFENATPITVQAAVREQ